MTAFDAAGVESMYLVLYQDTIVPSDAATVVEEAGGTLVYSYDAIGVVPARSSNPAFAENISADDEVEGASATTGFATQLTEAAELASLPDATPAPGEDPLSPEQWDMVQIHAPEARAINGGSPSVVVGIIDTGIDFTHPDLAANMDFGRSVSCVGGVPNPAPSSWMDVNGHGTHTAGTVAAARNGIGIVGVAPNVRLANCRNVRQVGARRQVPGHPPSVPGVCMADISERSSLPGLPCSHAWPTAACVRERPGFVQTGSSAGRRGSGGARLVATTSITPKPQHASDPTHFPYPI